jgi:hypothetical protein
MGTNIEVRKTSPGVDETGNKGVLRSDEDESTNEVGK